MSKPDILFYLSDQHHGLYGGFAGHPVVRTPNMDAIAASGAVFESAYTPCPLCVPARAALLSGKLPSKTGGFSNGYILPSGQATFLHALAEAGYETVLCGRMHFLGPDQRHGFTKRIFGDMCSLYGKRISDPVFGHAYGADGSLNVCGGGNSPVLDYDRAVVREALEYLARDHDKPQCVIVGTYGPHSPYVAPPDLFESYLDKVNLPLSWNPDQPDPNPLWDEHRQRTRRAAHTGKEEPVTEAVVRGVRAAYFGMITEQDRLLGEVRAAWRSYLDRTQREGVWVYASDHGDTCGEHGIFGKETLCEGAVRVPLLFEGVGVPVAARFSAPVSLLDIGPTLCDVAGGTAPHGQDGISLWPTLAEGIEGADRAVYSDWMEHMKDPDPIPARMVRKGSWKLIRHERTDVADQLFEITSDPEELINCIHSHPDVYANMVNVLEQDWDPERVKAMSVERVNHQEYIRRYYLRESPPEPPEERWQASPDSLVPPLIPV